MQIKDGKVIFFEGKEYRVDQLKKGDIIGDPKTGFQYLGGKGRWMNFKNLQTGEETVKYHDPKRISKYNTCNHKGRWELVDSNGNIQCSNCGLGQRIVWGVQIVKDGNIHDLKPKKN